MKVFQRYLDLIARTNGLARETGPAEQADVEWRFYPGMLQESCGKWWADFGTRATCHEGIDICFFRSGPEPAVPLAPGAAVPALFGGTVLNISGDLLGKSVVISLAREAKGVGPVVMVYSHLDPLPGIAPGDRIGAGEVIGRTFDTSLKKSRLLPHLHLSCICLPPGVANREMTWSLFADRDRVFHINPVFL